MTRPSVIRADLIDLYRGAFQTIESMFYLWKVTGDVRWRERGWSIFEALEKETRVGMGFASLKTVETSPAPKYNDMPR